MNTPILFLVFNRPSLTQIVFDEIKKVKPKNLFVAIDGPREENKNDTININKIVEIFKDIDWQCDVKILQRDKNLGCGLAISSAIDWFFSNVEEGIILEDDCVPSIDFFNFCTEMLSKYRDNYEVMAINGSNPLSSVLIKEDYFYSKYNFVWGWATWKRSWELYEFDLQKERSNTRLINLIKSFKIDYISIRSWYKHLNQVCNGETDTWDYQWMYTCWKYNGLVITPRVNLIRNIGNFENPTHGVVNSSYLNLDVIKLDFPLTKPNKIARNIRIDKKIAKYRFGNYLGYFLKIKFNQYFSRIGN